MKPRKPYAVDTTVPVQRTKVEIEEMLTKYGATSFVFVTNQADAIIMFEFEGRRVRFNLPLPKMQTDAKTAKEHRAKWRALLLTIKSKLVSVDTGIEEFEEAFLSHIILADGSTVGDSVRPAVALQYKTGEMGPLLLTGPRQ